MSLKIQHDGFSNRPYQEQSIACDLKGRITIQTEFGLEYLTRREAEILKYILQGCSAKKIGLLLGISSRTVESYINTLKLKFHCNRKGDLVFACMKMGMFKISL